MIIQGSSWVLAAFFLFKEFSWIYMSSNEVVWDWLKIKYDVGGIVKKVRKVQSWQ